MRRRVTAAAAALLAATMLLVAPPAVSLASTAVDATLTDRWPVAPGIERTTYHAETSWGHVHLQVLTFRLDDPDVSLRLEPADGQVTGLEATHEATRRLGDSAVAAVNGGFFDYGADPLGDPIGLLVSDGEYLSQPERAYDWSWRGGFGLLPDGGYIVGRPGFRGFFTRPTEDGDQRVTIDGISRRPAVPDAPDDGELTVFGPGFGGSTGTPEGTLEIIVRRATLRPMVTTPVQVWSSSTDGDALIPDHGIVLAATGTKAEALTGLVRGDSLTMTLEVTDGWGDVQQAVAAGPLMLTAGEETSRASWEKEGFNPATHSDKRHPRTAIGFTADGRVLLATADGRQRSSVGLTTAEMVEFLRSLGAVDAVMLDGGGSSTMVVDDRIVNRPCCDSAGYRRVASNVVLHTSFVPTLARRIGGADRYATAARIATEGWQTGAREVLLANGRSFPDGLAGGPLAARLDAPLLFTETTDVPAATLDALDYLGTTRITVLGGTAAVSEAVVTSLKDAGFEVRRLSGASRILTAIAIAQQHGAASGTAVLVSSQSFPDALAAAVPAALAEAPLLLTPGHALAPEVTEALATLNIERVVIGGGPAAISEDIVTELTEAGYDVVRISGPDRYATAAALGQWAIDLGARSDRVVLASGLDFPDALAGGAFGAHEQSPVLLVHPLDPARSPATEQWLDEGSLTGGTMLGSRGALSTWVAYRLEQALAAGPGNTGAGGENG